MRRAPIAAFVVALAFVRASAEPTTEVQQHLDAAATLYAKGKFAETLQELTLAYALDPQPELLFSIAQVHVKLGQCPQAITFYARFIATKPSKAQANVAREAIEVCKTAPPPPEIVKEPEKPPPPVPPEPRPTVVLPPPANREHDAATPWYGDKLGDALTVGGALSGGIGIAMYLSASHHRDLADMATTYPTYADERQRADSDRTLAIIFGVAGAALITGGVIRYVSRDDRTDTHVTVAPTRSGGVVAWTSHF